MMGLIAWVLGIGAKQLHAIESVHMVCPEHGELVDMAPSASKAHLATSEISADESADDHGHDCALQAISTFATVGVTYTPPRLPKQIPISSPNIRSESPRGPPLSYAPKTSPPLT